VVGQLVQVDGRQVEHQLVEFPHRLGGEGGGEALLKLVGGEPARCVMLPEQRPGPVAVRIRGA
jgi:hypothetical protein